MTEYFHTNKDLGIMYISFILCIVIVSLLIVTLMFSFYIPLLVLMFIHSSYSTFITIINMCIQLQQDLRCKKQNLV